MFKTFGIGLLAVALLPAGCGSNQDDDTADGGGPGNLGTGGAATGGALGAGGSYGGAVGTRGGASSGGAVVGGASGGTQTCPGSRDGGAVGDTGTGGKRGGECGRKRDAHGGAWLASPAVPPALTVPAGAELAVHDRGVGVQIYTCTASGGTGTSGANVDSGATTYAWVLKAPDATLFDACGVEVGSHGAGPQWTSTVDGSAISGAKVMQADAPLAGAIPWLLLRATSTSGAGVFSDVSYVQRVNTSGGKAPATGCDASTVGSETRVDYSADYYFYTGGAGSAWLVPPTNVPAAIAVPVGNAVKIHDRGIGAQVYTCSASGGGDAGATTYAWALKAPDAILYDATFTQVGTHGAGPNWTSTDGSVVNGTKLQQADSPSGDAIPWLLLKASSTSGTGVFTDIVYVQRLDTAGGKAPSTGCDATTVTSETRVDYAADYYFFTSSASDGGAGG